LPAIVSLRRRLLPATGWRLALLRRLVWRRWWRLALAAVGASRRRLTLAATGRRGLALLRRLSRGLVLPRWRRLALVAVGSLRWRLTLAVARRWRLTLATIAWWGRLPFATTLAAIAAA